MASHASMALCGFAIGLAVPVLLQLRFAKRMARLDWQPRELLTAQLEFDALALGVSDHVLWRKFLMI